MSIDNLDIAPIKLRWNRSELMRAYDEIETLRHDIAQPAESGLNTSLLAVLDAIEAADIEWDGITRRAGVECEASQSGGDSRNAQPISPSPSKDIS